MSADMVIKLLRLLCPYLHEIADRTDNEVDNYVVDFICGLVDRTPEA